MNTTGGGGGGGAGLPCCNVGAARFPVSGVNYGFV